MFEWKDPKKVLPRRDKGLDDYSVNVLLYFGNNDGAYIEGFYHYDTDTWHVRVLDAYEYDETPLNPTAWCYIAPPDFSMTVDCPVIDGD